MRRKRLYIREAHSLPYRLNIGYWEGESGYPDRDFRVVSLKDFPSYEEARIELVKILETNKDKYC